MPTSVGSWPKATHRRLFHPFLAQYSKRLGTPITLSLTVFLKSISKEQAEQLMTTRKRGSIAILVEPGHPSSCSQP